MRKEVDSETKEIIDSFIAEGFERLDDAEAKLERLGCADDADCLGAVFRLFHSVKGSAGYLGFENVKLLTHEAETLLDQYIKSKEAVEPEGLDLILKTIDLLRGMIGIVQAENSDESGAEAAKAGAAAIRGFLDIRAARAAANRIELSELVTAEMTDRFLAECSDLTDEIERKALSIAAGKAGPEAVNEIFRSVHTMKGNAGFFGYGFLEKACMELESLLDRARRGESPVNEALANQVIERVDAMRGGIGCVAVVGAGGGGPAGDGDGGPRGRSEEEGQAYRPLGEILIDLGAVREEDVKRALDQQDKPIGELLVESGATDPASVAKALELQHASGGAERQAADEVQRKEIRVDTAKLDRLFDLVGELITAEAMVLNSPDLRGLKLDHFSKAFSSLNKISRDIQETAMMIRMIPLEGLFHKMTRLVRDLSRKFGKQVEFRPSGQETEMDKNVIEQISDPLVHILRNAIDHGLEGAEERAAAGKTPAGEVRLEAKYEGSEIWISVKDDGRGLNRERILRKAVERGLVSGDGAALKDEEVWKFIFEPGFSTADRVTEVSGRGVGMDVVKRNLERIRGRVDIRTAPGSGTEFILKIPLTMAIIDGITVRSGSSYYSIPLADILEFFKAAPGQITATNRGEEMLNLRGNVLPVIKLGEVFRISGAAMDASEGIIIVVQSAGSRVCLLIDEVVGNQQIVVKSLSEYLGKVEGISGCSILGDGTVSFIIDTAKLIALRIEAAVA